MNASAATAASGLRDGPPSRSRSHPRAGRARAVSSATSAIRSLRAAVAFLSVLTATNVGGSPGERWGPAYFPAPGALTGLAQGAVFPVLSSVTTPLLAAAGG